MGGGGPYKRTCLCGECRHVQANIYKRKLYIMELSKRDLRMFALKENYACCVRDSFPSARHYTGDMRTQWRTSFGRPAHRSLACPWRHHRKDADARGDHVELRSIYPRMADVGGALASQLHRLSSSYMEKRTARVLASVALIATMAIHFAVVIPLFHLDPSVALAQRAALMKMPYWFRILMVLRAAVVEEIIFRGYLIEKIRQLTGSKVLAVAISVLAFTGAHLHGWGFVQLIPVCATGLILALLYIWKRDLPSNMFAHFLTDAAGFLTQ